MTDDEFSSKWRFAVGDPAQMSDPEIQRIVDDGIAAAPEGFLREDVLKMLPRQACDGICRICGKLGPLTKEHIPPRASGNKHRFSSHSFEEWIARNTLDIPDADKIEQGGIYGYTLCSGCNSLTGTRYGTEYKAWVAATLGAIASMPGPEELNLRAVPFAWQLQLGSKETGGVRPGALVRQILSMMCTLSGTWDLAGRHPEVRRIILEQSQEPLGDKLALGASLYFGPRIRILGPQMKITPATGSWTWLMEIAYPPFAFLLVLDSNLDEPGTGLMMTDWVQYASATELKFEGQFEVGFGWVPYPGDYRSRAALVAQAGVN